MISLQENSEFNTGKPPAGEAGMCAIQYCGQSGWQFWNGEFFGYQAIVNGIAWAHEFGHINGAFAEWDCSGNWRWATFAEVSAEVGPEEAAKMVHKSQLPEAVAEPTPTEVEATQEPCTPESYVEDLRADEAAMNAPMLQRDSVAPYVKPAARAIVVAEPLPWHLRCAPWTNRFGGWGATQG